MDAATPKTYIKRNLIMLSIALTIGFCFLLHSLVSSSSSLHHSIINSYPVPYAFSRQSRVTTPSLSIIARTYAGDKHVLYNQLLLSYNLYWPIEEWSNSDIVLIFDEENEADHKLATIIGNVPPKPLIKFEKTPPNNTLCSNWRRAGYARQQYSTFFFDKYTSAAYIGMVDSDASFVTEIEVSDLFVNGKPRIIAGTGYVENVCKPIELFFGENSCVAEFMTVIGFPIVIKREHFREIREHMIRTLNVSSFAKVFHHICSTYEHYYQFGIMVHYLWYYRREEYAWHIRSYYSEDTSEPWGVDYFKIESLDMLRQKHTLELNIPKIGLMKHDMDIWEDGFDYICVASQWTAGDCRKSEMYSEIGAQTVQKNLLRDRYIKTRQKHIPWQGELPWELPLEGLNYSQIYQERQSKKQYRKDWQRWNSDGVQLN